MNRELLPELARRGKSIIAITHDDRYFDCADRLVRLEEGRILSDGPVAPEQTDMTERRAQ
ncbi:MAG: hypothetical protein AAGK78_15785 [Planctomycetota bacterium]